MGEIVFLRFWNEVFVVWPWYLRFVISEDGGSLRTFFIKIVWTIFFTELVENRDFLFFEITQNRTNFMLILHYHFVKNETFWVFLSTKVLKRRMTPKLFLFNTHDLVDLQESNEHIQKSSEKCFQTTKRWTRLSSKSFFLKPFALTPLPKWDFQKNVNFLV